MVAWATVNLFPCQTKPINVQVYDVINKAKMFKFDTSKLEKSLTNLIRKGYNLAKFYTVLSLRWVYFANDIDNRLEQQVGQSSNYISTSIFPSILYYYFFSLIFDDLFIVASHEDQ